ncbi:MAG: S49 family peptidase [Thalassobaculales bacterium]
MLGFLRRLVVGLLALIGLAAVLVTVFAFVAGHFVLRYLAEEEMPASAVLELRLGDGIVEAADGLPLARLRGQLTLAGMVQAIDRAAGDAAVTGLLIDLSGARLGLAQAQELAQAVRRFAAAGKPTTAFADSFGELGGGLPAYLVAAAADTVAMQPSGTWAVTGVAVDQPFLGRALAAIGLGVDVVQRHEFKAAAEPLSRDSLSPAARANLQALVDDLLAAAIDDLAAGRRQAAAAIRAAIDRAPLTAAEALAAGLVDRLAYYPDLTGGRRLGTLAHYAAGSSQGEVALVTLSGMITREGFSPGQGADAVARALDAAREDAGVRAVVLRIDSPGGAYAPSDAIRAAVLRLRAAGKPVVAWMGNLAASGGYFAAMAADRIIAQPATITGSVGVVGAKPDPSGLLAHAGIGVDGVAAGANARAGSLLRGMTPAEHARFEALIDAAYADFTAKLAADRGLAPDALDRAARGRVFAGTAARQAGLADRLGGLGELREELRGLLKLPAGAPVTLRPYPEGPGSLRQVLRALRQGELTAALSQLAAGLAEAALVAVPQPLLLAPLR